MLGGVREERFLKADGSVEVIRFKTIGVCGPPTTDEVPAEIVPVIKLVDDETNSVETVPEAAEANPAEANPAEAGQAVEAPAAET